jgi:hypothetical protein
MVSKVDLTVDCRDFQKKSQLLQLVDCRFFVDFAVDFSSDFSGKVEEFVQNGLQIFKIFRQSQQSTTWPIRDPATVDFSRESWPYCRLWFLKLTGLLTSKIFIQRLSTSQKKSCNSRFMTNEVDCRLRGLERLPRRIRVANRFARFPLDRVRSIDGIFHCFCSTRTVPSVPVEIHSKEILLDFFFYVAVFHSNVFQKINKSEKYNRKTRGFITGFFLIGVYQ